MRIKGEDQWDGGLDGVKKRCTVDMQCRALEVMVFVDLTMEQHVQTVHDLLIVPKDVVLFKTSDDADGRDALKGL